MSFIKNANGFNTTESDVYKSNYSGVENYIDSYLNSTGTFYDEITIKNIEVICDWAYESKPSTFNLNNDSYIIENDSSTTFTIYHITYRKLSE